MGDASIRALEKQAATGDGVAERKLYFARERAGIKQPLLPAEDPEGTVWEREAVSAAEGMWRQKPRIGVGASTGYGSDSYPATVVAVSKSGHQVTLRHDCYRVVSGAFTSNDAVCEYYAPAPGDESTFVVTRRGTDRDGRPVYKQKGAKRYGGGVGFGFRRYHQDPSF